MAISNSKAFQVLTIDEILPLLASSYEGGRLAPFIGAGMSRRKFADWSLFVQNLETEAGAHGEADNPPEVRAQRAAATIRNSYSEDKYWEIVGNVLHGEDFENTGIPKQTEALAAIYWPLTISTNYDHLFYCACRQHFETRLPPLILGRSAEDCKQLMSGLVSPFDREIIWHIQGFLGETCEHCRSVPVSDPRRAESLRRELVIGHSEYRQATTTDVHFRRCFGEVFRTRSFLFLGSNLSEDYFWNLFGETLELCGPSPVPHFAFLPKAEKIDVRFLAEEMNITVCEYDDHTQLVPWLQALKDLIDHPHARLSRWKTGLRSGSSLEIEPYSQLPLPELGSDCAVAIVVKACEAGSFDLDADLDDFGQKAEFHAKLGGRVFEPGRHVLSPEPGLFAVRARTKPEGETESDSVGRAVDDLLCQLDGRWNILHLHLPSAGGTVPPIYGFIEVVRAFGEWQRENTRSLRLIAHVGPQVLLNITSRQIGLHELLTSDLVRFWTVVNSKTGAEPVRRVLYRPPKTQLSDVMQDVLGVMEDKLGTWTVSLCPSPTRKLAPVAPEDFDKALCDVGIVFGSIVTLERSASRSGGATAPDQAAAAG